MGECTLRKSMRVKKNRLQKSTGSAQQEKMRSNRDDTREGEDVLKQRRQEGGMIARTTTIDSENTTDPSSRVNAPVTVPLSICCTAVQPLSGSVWPNTEIVTPPSVPCEFLASDWSVPHVVTISIGGEKSVWLNGPNLHVGSPTARFQ
jgi:hypothetical protein